MSGIRVVNVSEVDTNIGKCYIELCIGDITALPKHEEVDVLVLSAFPGDYSPTQSSLVGQLQIKLGVSVKQLAKDKEEDLRKLYSCWWSKPLSEHLSFRRILCFEGGRSSRPIGEVVGDVFRCLVPILANSEAKVIMPILASGDQQKSKTKMLRLLMNAAVHWMKAGLALRSLKIVIFSRNIDKISKADQPLFDLFQELKENYAQDEKQGAEIKDQVESAKYDICLSYSEEDIKCVDQVIGYLVKSETNIRIFSTIQELDEEKSWQTQLYDVIKRCKRVMTLITPSFLRSKRCTEQYNIALCHSRKTQKSILMPLYLSEVQYMPTYMRITQYIDCRISFEEKLNAACITVIGSLSCEQVELLKNDVKDTSTSQETSNQTYDVFLSYSHRNLEHAMRIIKELRVKKPDLNIFIDRTELKAGGAWQLTLYTALDCSKSVIALISDDYLNSKVCNEEMCLAVALQLQNNCKIWPLVIEPIHKDAKWLKKLSLLNCYEGSEKENNIFISSMINQFLAAVEEDPEKMSLPVDIVQDSLNSCLEEARSLFMDKDFVSLVNNTPTDAVLNDSVPIVTFLPKDTDCNVDIYIISSSEDAESCSLLKSIIMSKNDSLVVKISTNEDASTRLTYLDKARLTIPLLSTSFMKSSELVHELNIAWCRQRDCSNLCFLAIVLEQLTKNPTYVSLFPCFFNCGDNLWTKGLETLQLFSSEKLINEYRSCRCPLNVVLCFMSAVHQIQKWLDGDLCPILGVHSKLFNCLHLNNCIQIYKEILSGRGEQEEENDAIVACINTKETEDGGVGEEKFGNVVKRDAKSHETVVLEEVAHERSSLIEDSNQPSGESVVENEENEQDDTNKSTDTSKVKSPHQSSPDCTFVQLTRTRENVNTHVEEGTTDKEEKRTLNTRGRNVSSSCAII